MEFGDNVVITQDCPTELEEGTEADLTDSNTLLVGKGGEEVILGFSHYPPW
jgi:hypothetical protein